jgi:hypothetical protein
MLAHSLLNILTEAKNIRKFATEKVVSLLKKYFACASNDFRDRQYAGWESGEIHSLCFNAV